MGEEITELSDDQRKLLGRVMQEAFIPFMKSMTDLGMPKEKITAMTIDVVKVALELANKYK